MSNHKSNDNIFDLTKLTPYEVSHEIKHSPLKEKTEIMKLIQGYKEVMPNEWDNLAVNDSIRYLRKDGTFRRGGLIRSRSTMAIGKHAGKSCFTLSAPIGYKNTTWVVCYDDIDKIWVKIATENTEVNNIIKSQQETITYLSKTVDQLKIDMAKLNNEQKRTINLIKKLHNIKTHTTS